MTDLTSEQKERYHRNILLPSIGIEGQKKILNAQVLIVGSGGLGSPIALYLAAAGVGHIGIIDADRVDLSNLQRQIIHSTPDLGRLKVESAQEKIERLNPDTKVTTYHTRLTSDNAEKIISSWDFIVDATDNFQTKFLINDTCIKLKKPFSHGAIRAFTGQTFTHVPGTTCYRCYLQEPPAENDVPRSHETGVFGAIAGMLGTIQAAEVLKYFTGSGELLTNKLLTFDALNMKFRTMTIHKRDNCICQHPKKNKI